MLIRTHTEFLSFLVLDALVNQSQTMTSVFDYVIAVPASSNWIYLDLSRLQDPLFEIIGELYKGMLHSKSYLAHSPKLHSVVMNKTCHIRWHQHTMLSLW